ncbi:centrosomal protein of 78 kDa [Amia ocellicauda]|uniref:centrosomal protein of 78 kDa n=1 Tax=Amia ocellicauda TaxID=2972642 RepID=UPI0034645372
MMDTVQIRRRGAVDFKSYYEYACALQDMVPLPAVTANLSQGLLDINGDRIKLADWTPILNSLSINKHLHYVALRSYHQPGLGESDRYRSSFKKRIPAFRSKDMTLRLCRAVRDCLSVSCTLKSLELQGLPLRERDLIVLTKGLSKSSSLENLSLAYCPIADEGLEVICQSVKNSSTIKTVNFTGCNLTWRGAEHMANIIKHQATKRHSEAWAESLRYRRPDLDCMTGLRRITLCCNTLIGDRGAVALADALGEDLWLKALDLQKCGITNIGAQALLTMLHSNNTICILDLRKNPLVDNALVKLVIERVLVNANEANPEYDWIKPTSSKDPMKPKQQKRTILLGNGVKGKATIRIGPRKSPSNGRSRQSVGTQYVPHPLPPGAVGYIPWRTAARACRHRGISQDVHEDNVITEHPAQAGSPVKVFFESDYESEEPSTSTQSHHVPSTPEKITVRQFKRLQVELEECRLRLKEEKRARVRADARLVQLEVENKRLRNLNLSMSEALRTQSLTSSVLEDEAVLESIETSFHKFHAFLDLLKDAGLGQLASMAGIDQNDFGPLGLPQMSSTVGRNDKKGTEETEHKSGEMSSSAAGNTNFAASEYKSGQVNGAPSAWKEIQETLDLQFTLEGTEEVHFKYPSESGRASLSNGVKISDDLGKQQMPSAFGDVSSSGYDKRGRKSSASVSEQSGSQRSGSQSNSAARVVTTEGADRSEPRSPDSREDQLSRSGSELHEQIHSLGSLGNESEEGF